MLPSEEWDPCPTGTISNMVSERRRRHRRTLLGRTVRGSAAAMLLLASVMGLSMLLSGGSTAQAMSCQRAVELFAGYHQEQLGDEEQQQVQAHLEQCPHCREAYERDYGHEARRGPRRSSELIAATHVFLGLL